MVAAKVGRDECAEEMLAVALGTSGEVREVGGALEATVEQLEVGEKCAWARYELGGKRGGVLKRRKEWRKRQLARVQAARRAEEEAMARGMKRYLEQQGLATVGVSGRVLEAVGERWQVEVEARRKVRRQRAAPRPRKMSVARRAFEEGWAPDRWDRWKVDRVMEVRRPVGGGKGLEGRIRWAGRCLVTGLPWADSWEELRDAKGRMRCSVMCAEEARELEELRYGVRERREVRRRGVEEARVPQRGRWRGRLRGGLAAWQRERAAEVAPWWMAGEDEEGGSEEGEGERDRKEAALEDARKRRRRGGGVGRGKLRRRRSVVVSSEEEEGEEDE